MCRKKSYSANDEEGCQTVVSRSRAKKGRSKAGQEQGRLRNKAGAGQKQGRSRAGARQKQGRRRAGAGQ